MIEILHVLSNSHAVHLIAEKASSSEDVLAGERLQKASARNSLSKNTHPRCLRGPPASLLDRTYHRLRFLMEMKILFQNEKASKCFNSCKYDVFEKLIFKANFGHFASLRIFFTNTMGFELGSLTSIPFSSSSTLQSLMTILCFTCYVLLFSSFLTCGSTTKSQIDISHGTATFFPQMKKFQNASIRANMFLPN